MWFYLNDRFSKKKTEKNREKSYNRVFIGIDLFLRINGLMAQFSNIDIQMWFLCKHFRVH